MINQQRPEKKAKDTGILDIHSIFHTIQGEGPYSGYPSVFVRLAGCNLQCPKCDTDYTSSRVSLIPDLIESAINNNFRRHAKNKSMKPLVVLTGGEPLRQDVTRLVAMLIERGYHVQIETNGNFYHELPWGEDLTVVCSPKTRYVNPKLADKVDAWKYVISYNKVSDDGLPCTALSYPVPLGRELFRPTNSAPVYVSPEDSKEDHINKLNMQACVSSCLEHGHILSLQTHKIIGVE